MMLFHRIIISWEKSEKKKWFISVERPKSKEMVLIDFKLENRAILYSNSKYSLKNGLTNNDEKLLSV